ncbi:hypothetical protein [Companilactobacillus nodensis]|uniref:hypothetical protein n=1 Tax=Companilactobacillus nodensis TaxID=460870 RepID=UPI00046AC4B1|nr:hypothetical protein [Companilactobacillus nodensis]
MADNYWMEREKKWLERRQLSDEELSKKLESHYRKAITDIDKQISNFYVNYAADNKLTMADARKKVAKFDVQGFNSTAAKMVADKDFSKEANDKLQLYNSTMKINRLEMLKAQTGLALTEMDDGIYRDVNMHLTTSFRNEVKRQAGILGDQKLDNISKKVDQVVNASTNGAKFSDRIWVAHDELKGRLDGIISRAMIQGTNPNQLKQVLYPLIDKTIKNRSYVAKRIAITETARVEDVAQMESFKASGYEYCVWIASIDACGQCADIAAYHDGIYLLSKVPNIPIHANCRCSKAASMGPKDKELEKAIKSDSSEDNISNKFENSNMKHVFGDEFYNNFTKTINSPEFDPRLRRAINRYADKYKFYRSSSSSVGNSFGFNIVNLTDEAFTGNSYKEPLETVFHELGHAMDHFSLKE